MSYCYNGLFSTQRLSTALPGDDTASNWLAVSMYVQKYTLSCVMPLVVNNSDGGVNSSYSFRERKTERRTETQKRINALCGIFCRYKH